MSRKGWRRIGLALGALLLAVLVGCQSVGGFDPTKMIVNQLNVKSAESSSTFEIQFNWDEEALAQEDPDAAKIAELFRNITLKSDHAAVDKNGNVAIDGEFAFAKGSIPFSLTETPEAIVLKVDGIKQPIVMETGGEGIFSVLGEEKVDNAAYKELAGKITEGLTSYVFGHVPNPPVFNVGQVSDQVHGVNLSLTKVHVELNGQQLGDLVTEFLDSISKDEQGLRQLIQQFAQLVTTLPPETLDSLGLTEEDAIPTGEQLDEFVKEMLSSFAEARDEVSAAKSEPEWSKILSDNLTFESDLFVDSDLHVRKSEMEIGLASGLFKDSGIPLKGVTIHSSQETWNVNGDVEVPAADVPESAIDASEFYFMQPFELLRLIDQDSTLYGLLKNDLAIDDQEFTVNNYITDNKGDIYVPLRPTLMDFGTYRLTFDKKGNYIQFKDEATGQSIQLQAGTNAAKLNGSPLKLKHATLLVHGIAYVSADDLFGLLHAQYSFAEGANGDRQLVVTRDL